MLGDEAHSTATLSYDVFSDTYLCHYCGLRLSRYDYLCGRRTPLQHPCLTAAMRKAQRAKARAEARIQEQPLVRKIGPIFRVTDETRKSCATQITVRHGGKRALKEQP